MNKNNEASLKCSHCEYDCNRTQHTTSFIIRKIDHEKLCAERNSDPEFPNILSYVDVSSYKRNPKQFYFKWKELVDGTKYQVKKTEICQWKAMNDFAIVNVYLNTPTIPRMKQDVKHKLHDKLSLLGNQTFFQY